MCFRVNNSLEEVARRLHLGLPSVDPLAHGFPTEPDPVLGFHLAGVGLHQRPALRVHLAGVRLNLGSSLGLHLAGVGLYPFGVGLDRLAHGLATETYSVLPFHLGYASFSFRFQSSTTSCPLVCIAQRRQTRHLRSGVSAFLHKQYTYGVTGGRVPWLG